MIFDKNYDIALWLMLQGDKYNKRLILEFINKLNNEMYISIYNLIDEYKSSNRNELYSEVIGEGYRFLVQIKDKMLTLVLNTFDPKKNDGLGDRYELSLLSITENLFSDKKDKNIKIGSFSFKKVESDRQKTGNYIHILDDIFYELGIVGDAVHLKTRDSHNLRILSLARIDMSNIPNDIYTHYFCKKWRKCRIREK